jgi:hypothetical protein
VNDGTWECRPRNSRINWFVGRRIFDWIRICIVSERPRAHLDRVKRHTPNRRLHGGNFAPQWISDRPNAQACAERKPRPTRSARRSGMRVRHFPGWRGDLLLTFPKGSIAEDHCQGRALGDVVSTVPIAARTTLPSIRRNRRRARGLSLPTKHLLGSQSTRQKRRKRPTNRCLLRVHTMIRAAQTHVRDALLGFDCARNLCA